MSYEILAVFLLVNLAAALARVLRGPAPSDRMLGAQLVGTTGVAILLVLARAHGAPALRDAALLLALLSVLVVVAFVRRSGAHQRAKR